MLWEEASICTLCQRRIGSEIANPSKCSHCFHAECIRKYANENNYGGRSKCPVKGCRNIFLRIDVRNEASNDKFPQFIIVESRHRCPICGDVIQDPFAKTNICQHNFCYQCLKESATYRTICPVDRKNFTEIFIFDRNKDPIFKSEKAPQVICLICLEPIATSTVEFHPEYNKPCHSACLQNEDGGSFGD